MYKNNPEFEGFDFDQPSNIQGVEGSRSSNNVHQLITNEWDNFANENPHATRRQIEDFATLMDKKYGNYYFK